MGRPSPGLTVAFCGVPTATTRTGASLARGELAWGASMAPVLPSPDPEHSTLVPIDSYIPLCMYGGHNWISAATSASINCAIDQISPLQLGRLHLPRLHAGQLKRCQRSHR